MVNVRTGDLFDSAAQTLVNTINTVGIMGKGVALKFKEVFPDMYEDYVRRCDAREVRLGEPYLYKRLIAPWILNFPTKDHWRSVARIEDIICGLEYLKRHYREWGITSLAVPPLGCGQGGLEWRVVGPILYRHLNELDIPVELYAPFGTPHEELRLVDQPAGTPPSKIEAGWVALVEILNRIEEHPYHWRIGRTTFQKIAYFATQLHIATGLQYQRGSYGPYASTLKNVISRLVNNGLIVERRHGNMLAVSVGPTFLDARRAYDSQLEKWNVHIDQVSDLFLRMTTQRAEIAATVHFACKELTARVAMQPTEQQVLEEVMHWKQKRRPPLPRADVQQMIRTLAALEWIDVRSDEGFFESEDDEDVA